MQPEDANTSYSVLDLFKTPRLRNITLLLTGIWMAISFVFEGHVINNSSSGWDLFSSFSIAAATELPALSIIFLLDHLGLRWLTFGSMVMSGVFSALVPTVSSKITATTLATLGRICIKISYNIGLQYTVELLPTVVRAQGVAFIHIMGYVASILAQFIVSLQHFHSSITWIVIGSIGIIGGILSLFLPETVGHKLPQTLADGEDFGRGQGMWDFPCFSKKVDDDNEIDNESGNFQRAQSIGQASLRASTKVSAAEADV